MSKKIMMVIGILLIAVGALSACQVDEPTPGEDTPVPGETPPAQETPIDGEPTPVEPPDNGEPASAETPEEVLPPTEDQPVHIVLWTKESEADRGLQYVNDLVNEYTSQNPNVTIEVVNLDVETLREDFLDASLAGNPPDLLWTVSDHAGPFTEAGLLEPVQDLFDMDQYVTSVVLGENTWGVPISSGNHLMLIYNRSLLPEAPQDTNELVQVGQDLTGDNRYALVYNQTEPLWLVPWLGGFGGSVFAEDGVTPTLDTPEMVATLEFLHSIKYDTPLVPRESDYDEADTLFKEGQAAMIINSGWSLVDYREILGDDLGVAPIPQVSETGQWPAPFTSGSYYMIPEGVEEDKLAVIVDFIRWSTNEENQLEMVRELARLPGLLSAFDDPLITEDPLLSSSAEQMELSIPMPEILEMRCIWVAIKPEMAAVLNNTTTPQNAASNMQGAAEACIRTLNQN
jgi:arabinogalactan oligomer / maltooligosaccharide transport system substrate-binding protein